MTLHVDLSEGKGLGQTKLVEVMEFQLSYFKSCVMGALLVRGDSGRQKGWQIAAGG